MGKVSLAGWTAFFDALARFIKAVYLLPQPWFR